MNALLFGLHRLKDVRPQILWIALIIWLGASLPAQGQIPGPYYPPPQGTLSFSVSPTTDGAIGKSGGENWYFSNVTMAASSPLFWGVSNNGVAFSMINSSFSSSEIMHYNSSVSSPASGSFVFEGQTEISNITGPPSVVYTRFVMTITNQPGAPAIVFDNPTNFGLSTNVGSLVSVNSTNVAYQVNMLFEASSTYGSGYSPALEYFNGHPHLQSSAYSSITGGFYLASPPQLLANGPLTVVQGARATITSNLLDASSTLVGDNQLTYTIATGAAGGTTRNGTIYLYGNPLTNGSTFFQSDIDAGGLAYQNNGSCQTNDDFEFSVSDPYGDVIPTGQFVSYDFPIIITYDHEPPLAINSSIIAPVGGSANGTLSASNVNCLPVTFTYSIVTNASKGTITLNTNTGAYTFNSGFLQSGADSFWFQVYDGTTNAANPGQVTVQIVRVPPVANPGSGSTIENMPFAGDFSATDPNHPSQPLTISIVTNGTLGTAVITNASTGAFVYTPKTNAFGVDTIYFVASQGTNVSAPATFTISVRATLDPGHLFIVDEADDSIVEVDPVNGYASIVTSSNLLGGPVVVAIEPKGTLIVGDSTSGLVRVNPITGAQTQLASITNFTGPSGGPIGLAIDPTGGILVADLTSRIQRFDPVTGVASNVTSGGLLTAGFGLAVGANRAIYVTDAGAFVGGACKLLQIDPDTGAQTALLTNGLNLPTGIAVTASNILYFCDTGSVVGQSDSIDRYDLNVASGGVWLTNAALSAPVGIAVGENQILYISENKTGINLDSLNTSTAALSALGPVGGNPFGIAAACVAPQFTGETLQPGAFQATLSAEAGRFVAVLSSSNLLDWQYLAAIPATTNTVIFTDPASTNVQARYYRAFGY